MIYKDRIIQLLETLSIKLESLEKYNNGTLNLTRSDAASLINEIKQLTERISNLVSNER